MTSHPPVTSRRQRDDVTQRGRTARLVIRGAGESQPARGRGGGQEGELVTPDSVVRAPVVIQPSCGVGVVDGPLCEATRETYGVT